ncbi:MAG: hypothetical protein ACTSR2_02495 [Candidatus Hodarchaeales archaeon]
MEPEKTLPEEEEIVDHSHPDYEEVMRSLSRRMEQMENDEEKKKEQADTEDRDKFYEQADDEEKKKLKKEQNDVDELKKKVEQLKDEVEKKAKEQADFSSPAGGDVEDKQDVKKSAEDELIDTRLKAIEETLRRMEQNDSFGEKPVVAPEEEAPKEPSHLMERIRRRRTVVGNQRFSERMSGKNALKEFLKHY